MRIQSIFTIPILNLFLLISGYAQSNTPQLWFWMNTAPLSQSDLTTMESQVDLAASAGYTGILMQNGIFDVMGSPVYPVLNTSYLQQLVTYIESKNMKFTAGVAPFGWSDNQLVNNPNWAEGEHITGAQFTVNASKTALVPVNSFGGLVNGGFEQGRTGWFDIGDPGTNIDTAVYHSGMASGVITNAGGNARFYQVIQVIPWRQYRGRMWVKTSNFAGYAQISVYDGASGTNCFVTPLQQPATQDWTEVDFTFNSRGTSQPALYFGVWGGSSGSIWFDDVSVEETALVYVLRRSGTPLKVYDANNANRVFTEGPDFNAIADPQLTSGGYFPFYGFYHAPGTVTLPASTLMTPGETIAIDFYAVQPITPSGDVGICLTESGALNWLLKNAQTIVNNMPSGINYLLGYDEMRHMNSCSTCKARNMTPGQLLGWHVTNTVNLYHSLAPSATLYTWSDMFDPYHNAVNNYYYVEGDIAGSWTGLPSSVTVMNWNLRNLTNSLNWFSGLNPQQPIPHSQIIAGYYDSGNGAASATQELQQATGIPGVQGLMYYTSGDYSQAAAFATAAKSNWPVYLASIVSTVTNQVTISGSVVTYNRVSQLYSQSVKLTNNGAALPAAAFVMDSLPAGVSVVTPSGTTSAAPPVGSPYIEAGPIGAGATVTLSIQFTRTGTPPVIYNPRVLGAGPR